ncbi:hypothetical protein [Coleofasciculus sp. E2-BRE-01]|uniref:hypothetical protein n=1 Tax=Coleofasciculus sp. E2-BRE-01 TaxID=3069524 RepID=UPI0032F16077
MKLPFAIVLLALIGVMVFLIWRDSQHNEGIDPHLLKAVKGNKGLAKRLLDQAQMKYPGKSDRWYAEKIIYDLERDGAGSGRRSSYGVNRRELRENIFLAGSMIWLVNSVTSLVGRLLR